MGAQEMLVGADGLHAERLHIVDRRAQADRLHEGRSPRLEAQGRIGIDRLFERHGLDHVAAALPRGHGRQPLRRAVEHADAGRPVELVAGEGVEIAADGPHVDRLVDDALRTVDQDAGAGRLRQSRHLGDRDDRAEHVRHMGDGDQLRAVGQQGGEFFEIELPVVLHRRDLEHDPLAVAQQLPGHDVGVVLHLGNDDLVARRKMGLGPGAGDQVDRLGHIPGEDDILRRRRVQQAGNLLAHAFIGLGRRTAQIMGAAMDVGVFAGIAVLHRIENGLRLLRARAVVEEAQRPVVDRARQDRKIPAHDGRIVGVAAM